MRFELTAEQAGFARSLDDLLSKADTPAVNRAWADGDHEPGPQPVETVRHHQRDEHDAGGLAEHPEQQHRVQVGRGVLPDRLAVELRGHSVGFDVEEDVAPTERAPHAALLDGRFLRPLGEWAEPIQT